jgi:DNA-binding CsgD family transcriptional regulator
MNARPVNVEGQVIAYRCGACGYIQSGRGIQSADDLDRLHDLAQQCCTTSTTPMTRELELLGHIVRERTTREIAEAMGISVKTAETHRANLMRKLNAHTTLGLVKAAIRIGALSPNEVFSEQGVGP